MKIWPLFICASLGAVCFGGVVLSTRIGSSSAWAPLGAIGKWEDGFSERQSFSNCTDWKRDFSTTSFPSRTHGVEWKLMECTGGTLPCWASLALLTLLKPTCSQQHPKDGDSGSGIRGIGSPCFNHGQASSGAHWSTALSWESEGLTWIE